MNKIEFFSIDVTDLDGREGLHCSGPMFYWKTSCEFLACQNSISKVDIKFYDKDWNAVSMV